MLALVLPVLPPGCRFSLPAPLNPPGTSVLSPPGLCTWYFWPKLLVPLVILRWVALPPLLPKARPPPAVPWKLFATPPLWAWLVRVPCAFAGNPAAPRALVPRHGYHPCCRPYHPCYHVPCALSFPYGRFSPCVNACGPVLCGPWPIGGHCGGAGGYIGGGPMGKYGLTATVGRRAAFTRLGRLPFALVAMVYQEIALA